MQVKRHWVICMFALFLAALVSMVRVQAQTVTASITGEVTDPSGAPVPGAKVTATDTERGTEFNATSGGDGRYNLPNLLVGTYNVKVENAGFQTATRSNVVLELNQVAKLDFQLLVGNISQSVEVTAEAPLLQTESTQVGQVIDARTNENLPLATRNYVQLTLLTAGSTHPSPQDFTNGQTTASSGRPYVNGNREQANNFMLDGMDNNQVSDNLVGYAPSVDSIQEFNEITQNAPAEFGNYMGAIVSVEIKSGSNQFHGDAFEFFRNNVLNANTWSNNFTGAPRPQLRWNEFGGTTGGPIKRDKLFFFADYQGQRFDTPTSIGATSVMTQAERNGDFSALLSLATPIQLYNPYSVTNGQRNPFPGNIIPSNLLSPVAQKILSDNSVYPLPTGPGLNNNLLYASHTYINGDQGDARVDWNISDKDRLFGRYSESSLTNPTTNNVPIFYNSFANYPTHNGVLDWTRSISPTIVNEARVGVNYVFINNGAAANGVSGLAQTVGLPDIPSSFLPSMSFSGGYAASIGNSDVYQLFADTVIQAEDTANITKGANNMHVGFQVWRERIDTFYSGNNGRAGTFDFSGRYTAGPNDLATAGNGSGLAEADFVLGLPDTIGGGVNGGTWGQRSTVYAAFFQDDWHVLPNLTLNLGLRWELHTPWAEVANRQSNFGLISGTVYLAGQSGCAYNNCEALYNQYNGITNFQPRIGLAWNPWKNTVVRSAYTLSNYLEGTGTNLRLPINPPFAHETSAVYTSLPFPGSTLDQGFSTLQASSNPYSDATIRLWDPNVRPAVSNQWNFTIQQQFTNSLTLQVGYVGQRTTHLMVPMAYFQSEMLSNGTVVPSPYLSGNPYVYDVISQISGTESNGNQSYNSLQAVLQKRLSGGLEGSVAYTYSKCMTNSSGYYGNWDGQTTPTSPYWQNIYDMKAEWGPCYYDVAHVLTSYATYDLPIGRGKSIGNNMNRVADAFIGGWQANAILTLHTGFAITLNGPDASGTGSRGARPDCIAPPDVLGYQNSPLGGYQWFSPDSYTAPAPGTFGSCGVGTVRGPGLHTLDFSLGKYFTFTEHTKLQFRAEAVNLTNTPVLNTPNASLGSTMGLIQSSQLPRQVQLALKLYF